MFLRTCDIATQLPPFGRPLLRPWDFRRFIENIQTDIKSSDKTNKFDIEIRWT